MLKKNKEMSLLKKILILALLISIIAVCSLGIWQRNNIWAVIKTFSASNEELAEELNVNKKVLENKIKEEAPDIVSDFTAEEEKMIMKGTLSVEEAVSNLNKRFEEAKDKNKTEKDNTDSAMENTNKQKSEKVEKVISDKVIELYSLKAYYLGQLGQMEAMVKKEYSLLPEGKKNLIGKQALVSKYMGRATSLLNQCDSQVNELLSSLKNELKANGADTSIINTIKSSYENEKALKKAYYLSLMK